ncbi:hypothetical protein [Lysinibacillus sp. NPDC096259]
MERKQPKNQLCLGIITFGIGFVLRDEMLFARKRSTNVAAAATS